MLIEKPAAESSAGQDSAGLLFRGNGGKIGWVKDGWLRFSCQAPSAPQGVKKSRAGFWSGLCWHLACCEQHPGKHEMAFTKTETKSKSSYHSFQVSQKMVQQELTILPSLLSAVNTACCTELHRPYSIWADSSEQIPPIPFFLLSLQWKEQPQISELATQFFEPHLFHSLQEKNSNISSHIKMKNQPRISGFCF